MKICKKCKYEKNIGEFCKNKNKKDGLDIYCNQNKKEDYENRLKYDINRKNKIKEYRTKNEEIIYKQQKAYRLINIENIKNNKKEYYSKNKESIREKNNKWIESNKDYYIQYQKDYRMKNLIDRDKVNEYRKNRRLNDPIFKVSEMMRNIIKKSLKNGEYIKKSNTESILGCSFEEFKIYLESKFVTWMKWNNQGLYNGELNYGWDVDHVIPLSSAKTEEDVLKLNHYSNLQPLCSKINRDIKKDKIKFNI